MIHLCRLERSGSTGDHTAGVTSTVVVDGGAAAGKKRRASDGLPPGEKRSGGKKKGVEGYAFAASGEDVAFGEAGSSPMTSKKRGK